MAIYSIYFPSNTRLCISSKCIAPLFVTEPSIPLSIIIFASLSQSSSIFCTKICSLSRDTKRLNTRLSFVPFLLSHSTLLCVSPVLKSRNLSYEIIFPSVRLNSSPSTTILTALTSAILGSSVTSSSDALLNVPVIKVSLISPT